jgi:hypothetical protein
MPSSGEAIPTMPTGDVSFGNDEIAGAKTFYVIAHAIHNADKLMANDHWNWNRFLRPRIPVIDVHVRATDGCFQDANQHVVAAYFWNRNIFEPKTGLRFRFDNRLHRRLHDSKLGESTRRGKSFASANAFWKYKTQLNPSVRQARYERVANGHYVRHGCDD